MNNKRLDFPSARRNAGPIVQVLKAALAQHRCDVLEIASGSGQHAVHFGTALPQLSWWPSDIDPNHIASIDAWRLHADMQGRIHEAQMLDVCSTNWREGVMLDAGPKQFDAIININMIHISPWEATSGLMQGAAHRLKTSGLLFLYGPFKRKHKHTAPSNADFDESLRTRNSQWGVRDMGDVATVAWEYGLSLQRAVVMPANNYCVIFERV